MRCGVELEKIGGEQGVFVETAREYARSVLLELDRRCDRDGTAITSILPELAGMGFLNLVIPEEFGGLGCSFRTYSAILHELAYASASTSVSISVHNMVGAILSHYANDEQRQAWLTAWGKPESFSAFAISEAGAGSDPASCQCRAQRKDDGYRINGEKMWISNGLSARWFFTLVRSSAAPPNRPMSVIMVDGNQPGVTRSEIHGKMGIRGSETVVVHYADAVAPMGALVGEEGQGLSIVLASLDRGRVGIAAQATGMAEACLDEMIRYSRQREQFGGPIGQFQAVQNMIADSAVELTAARMLIDRAALAIDAGRADPAMSAKAKLYATEAANRIAYRAVQVHGGSGYVHECRVEQLYRDARVTTIYEGTSEIQRLVIARDILRKLQSHP